MTEATPPPREIILTLANPVEGKDGEFRDWYWGEHISEVLGVPGFVSAQRYRAADTSGAAVPFHYATLYEVEGSAAEARDRLFGAGVGMSDTLDLSSLVFAPFSAKGERLTD